MSETDKAMTMQILASEVEDAEGAQGPAGPTELTVPDEEALPVVFDLLKHEGLCLGASSGVNVAGAIRMAKDMGPGHTMGTVLCDFGTKYQSKLFNPEFLREKDVPVPSWME